MSQLLSRPGAAPRLRCCCIHRVASDFGKGLKTQPVMVSMHCPNDAVALHDVPFFNSLTRLPLKCKQPPRLRVEPGLGHVWIAILSVAGRLLDFVVALGNVTRLPIGALVDKKIPMPILGLDDLRLAGSRVAEATLADPGA